MSRDILFSSQGASVESLTRTRDFSITPDYLIKVFHVGKDRTFMGEIFKISNYSIILYENHILFGSKPCAEANEGENSSKRLWSPITMVKIIKTMQ